MRRSYYLGALAQILFPKECVCCHEHLSPHAELSLCSHCRNKVTRNPPPHCTRCGRSSKGHILTSGVCFLCKRHPVYYDKAFAPYIYEGAIKRLITDFKSTRNIHLARTLAALAQNATEKESFLKQTEVIMSVPAYWLNEAVRLFNPVDILGREFARLVKRPYKNLLKKTRFTKHQRALKQRDRLQNLNGAFSLKRWGSVPWKRVLLIDDVFTTGTTVNECAKALKSSGCRDIFVLTIARGS